MLEAVQGLRTATEVLVINRPMDDMDDKLVSEFMRSGCGCTKDKGKPCSQLFSPEYVKSVRASCAELTRGILVPSTFLHLGSAQCLGSTVKPYLAKSTS